MGLPKAYNPKQVEEKIYKLWEKSGFFNPDKLPGKRKKPYTILLPPPNITGELHMGHALNAITQDILIRKKRMEGFKTLWLPGTDHAGIATQNVIERKLKKEDKSRFDLGREKFIKEIWKWKAKCGEIILDQLKKLGSSCDWSRTQFTLSENYSEAVKKAFLHYFKKGWIYRGKRPINWCPRCQTSLSDLELEYQEVKGKIWYLRYPLKIKNQNAKCKMTDQNSKFITVATTRPETMLGDTAIAVNPSDKRYKHLIGKKVILPIVNREIPIVADRLVDPKFGTGAVKVTPAHDLKDYEVGIRHNLEMIQVINERGEITQNVPQIYQGLKVLEARKRIIDTLKKLGLLEKEENYVHSIPRCYRCDTVIEVIPSQQWFLKIGKLAKVAKKAVKKGEIRFFPKNFEKIYFDWLKNIRDWCISRQIWWGHQLPVWQCQTGRNPKPQTLNPKSKEKYFISQEPPKKCPLCGKCKPKQVNDVLDTWFSSALWPFATLGWPKKTKDLKRFYPTQLLVTGRDILNLWVARMIFSGIEFMKKIPFSKVYIHPTVLTKEGRRMSKSLGIGVDPMDLIEKYGADATRFGIAWQITGGQDIRFGEENLQMGKKFCNKIWNATRFVLKNKPPQINVNSPHKFKQTKNLTKADKEILKALEKITKSVTKDLDNFQFHQAAQKLYQFFWHKFCDIYIEESKSQIASSKSQKEKEKTQKVLVYVLFNSLKLLHPFMPFITEEIYQQLPLKNKKKCLMVEKWPK